MSEQKQEQKTDESQPSPSPVLDIAVPKVFDVNHIPYPKEIQSVQDYVKRIINKYIKIDASLVINISHQDRQQLMSAYNHDLNAQQSISIFDPAAREMIRLLTFSFSRFKKTQLGIQDVSGYTLEYLPRRIQRMQMNASHRIIALGKCII